MQGKAKEAVINCKKAKRFYLHAPAEILHERIIGDQKSNDNRPSLTAQRSAYEEVVQVLKKRESTYKACADFLIDVSGKEGGVEKVVAKIIAKCTE